MPDTGGGSELQLTTYPAAAAGAILAAGMVPAGSAHLRSQTDEDSNNNYNSSSSSSSNNNSSRGKEIGNDSSIGSGRGSHGSGLPPGMSNWLPYLEALPDEPGTVLSWPQQQVRQRPGRKKRKDDASQKGQC
eukprot:1159841-Pelagomonas_calceolata.AAC.2